MKPNNNINNLIKTILIINFNNNYNKILTLMNNNKIYNKMIVKTIAYYYIYNNFRMVRNK